MTDEPKVVVSHPRFFSPENLERLRGKLPLSSSPITAGMLFGYFFLAALLAALLFLSGMAVAKGDVNVRALCFTTFGIYAVAVSLIAILFTGERLSTAASVWAAIVALTGMLCFLGALAFYN